VFNRKKNVGSNSGVAKPENRLLRLFRPNAGFQGSLISRESTDVEDTYNIDRKMIKNAMLEAEYQKAMALLAFEKHQRMF